MRMSFFFLLKNLYTASKFECSVQIAEKSAKTEAELYKCNPFFQGKKS